jgi:UDP-2,3-diacylglucosamine pyrophosphatase LpxH
MDCLSSAGQTERGVNCNEAGSGLIYPLVYFFIAKSDMRLSFQAAEHTYTCRAAWRPGKVYTNYDKRFTICHNDSLSTPYKQSHAPRFQESSTKTSFTLPTTPLVKRTLIP